MPNFKVKKGNKFFWGSRCNFFKRNKKEFNVKAYFHSNCVYMLTENYDQINKLTGESFRLFPWYDKVEKRIRPGHHKDSVRFGWRCIDGRTIELLSYVYISGKMSYNIMGSVCVNEWVHLNFKETNGYYNFRIITESGTAFLSKFKKESSKKGFIGLFTNRLYPYFGGKMSSPHSMNITLKYIEKFV